MGKFLHDAAREALSGEPEGQKVIRHFMHTLAEGIERHEDGFWNFVVSEKDMCSLILNDNKFVLDEAETSGSTKLLAPR